MESKELGLYKSQLTDARSALQEKEKALREARAQMNDRARSFGDASVESFLSSPHQFTRDLIIPWANRVSAAEKSLEEAKKSVHSASKSYESQKDLEKKRIEKENSERLGKDLQRNKNDAQTVQSAIAAEKNDEARRKLIREQTIRDKLADWGIPDTPENREARGFHKALSITPIDNQQQLVTNNAAKNIIKSASTLPPPTPAPTPYQHDRPSHLSKEEEGRLLNQFGLDKSQSAHFYARNPGVEALDLQKNEERENNPFRNSGGKDFVPFTEYNVPTTATSYGAGRAANIDGMNRDLAMLRDRGYNDEQIADYFKVHYKALPQVPGQTNDVAKDIIKNSGAKEEYPMDFTITEEDEPETKLPTLKDIERQHEAGDIDAEVVTRMAEQAARERASQGKIDNEDWLKDQGIGGNTPAAGFEGAHPWWAGAPQYFSDLMHRNMGEAYKLYNPEVAYPFSGMQRTARLTNLQRLVDAHTPDILENPEYEKAYKSAKGLYSQAQQQTSPELKPFLEKATALPSGMIDQYMNPYKEKVMDDFRKRQEEYLEKDVLPKVNAQFMGSGATHTGKRQKMLQEARQKMFDTITSKEAELGHSGYQNAMAAMQANQARQLEAGSLNQASRAADLARMENAGTNIYQLARTERANKVSALDKLREAGEAQQARAQRDLDLRNADITHQADWQALKHQRMDEYLRGTGPRAFQSSAPNMSGVPPIQKAQASPLSQLSGILQYGAAKQLGDMKFAEGGHVSSPSEPNTDNYQKRIAETLDVMERPKSPMWEWLAKAGMNRAMSREPLGFMQSLGQALPAYEQTEELNQQNQMSALKIRQMIEKEKSDNERYAQEREFEREKLDTHNSLEREKLLSQERRDSEDLAFRREALGAKRIMGEMAPTLTKQQISQNNKVVNEALKEGAGAMNALGKLKKVETAYKNLVGETNDLTGPGTAISKLTTPEAAEGTQGIIAKTLAKYGPNFYSKKAQSYKEEVDKGTNQMIVAAAEGLPPKGQNMYIQQKIAAGKPVASLTPEAFADNVESHREEFTKKSLRGVFLSNWFRQNRKDIGGAEEAFDEFWSSLPKDVNIIQARKAIPSVVNSYIASGSDTSDDVPSYETISQSGIPTSTKEERLQELRAARQRKLMEAQ